MPNEIDQALDQMTPTELAAVETEIDTRGTIEHYASLGAQMAQEAYGEFQKTGELPAILHLVKESKGFKNLPPEVQAKFKANKGNPGAAPGGKPPRKGEEKKSNVDEILDKCSAKELVEIEKEVDAQITKQSADESEKLGGYYFEVGRKMARETVGSDVKKK